MVSTVATNFPQIEEYARKLTPIFGLVCAGSLIPSVMYAGTHIDRGSVATGRNDYAKILNELAQLVDAYSETRKITINEGLDRCDMPNVVTLTLGTP